MRYRYTLRAEDKGEKDPSSPDRRKALDALLKRLKREDLSFFDEARLFFHITDVLGFTQKELAGFLGCSQSLIANKLRLLRFSEAEREAILRGGLTERHARTLLRLDKEDREHAIDMCQKKRMNVAHTEDMVDDILRRKEAKIDLYGEQQLGERRFVLGDLRFFYNSIDRAVGMLRLAGYPAEATRTEDENGVEIRIAVSKPKRFT